MKIVNLICDANYLDAITSSVEKLIILYGTAENILIWKAFSVAFKWENGTVVRRNYFF